MASVPMECDPCHEGRHCGPSGDPDCTCWCWDPANCAPCREDRHAKCIGRTEPDCDLVGDHYQQTNACPCERCEELAHERTPFSAYPYDVASGEAWTKHVDALTVRPAKEASHANE